MKNKSLKSRYKNEYMALKNAVDRCSRLSHSQWKDYGGRGLVVEPAWQNHQTGFMAFLDHIGPKPDPSFELDRIDNNRGYVENNVRWVSHRDNMKNRRKPAGQHMDLGWGVGHVYVQRSCGRILRKQCQLVPFENALHPITYVAQRLGLATSTLRQRVKKGWSADRVFSPTLYNPRGKPRIN